MVTRSQSVGHKPFILTPSKLVQLDGHTDTPTSSCTSPPPTQGRNNIIRTPGGTLLAVLEPLAVGGGEDGVEDHPLPPGERPGDDMDTDTDNGLDPSNPGVPPGVPPDGLEDPVYGLCTKQDCVSCETNEFTAPLPNNRLCTDNLCPTIHWHRKTSDCIYVKTRKNFTYNFSRKL